MVFSSLPIYLDPPNWQQQQQQQGAGAGGSSGGTHDNHNHHQLPPIVLQPPQGGGDGTSSIIRPGSMTERARLAKIPQPETALKCPRCESTNTKFCYFNNYSLSQPRHFCKTCRRYWTRGGALRNVPVGGGCRRNKRSKRSRSKSPIMSGGGDCQITNLPSTSAQNLPLPIPQVQLPSFFAPPHHDFGNNGENIGLNFCGIQDGNLNLRFGDNNQWKLQHFPNFFSGLEVQPSTFDHHEELGYVGGAISENQVGSNNKITTLEVEASHDQVKMEDNNSNNNYQLYWSGNNTSWIDLSAGTNSTPTAGHLI